MAQTTVETFEDGVRVDTHPAEIPDELAAHDARAARLRGAVATLRQWASDADDTSVTQGNAVQVLGTMVDRLGLFFDRFADLLENQYGGD